MSNPAARILENDRETFGSAVEYPYVGTTYSLTEHFHAWTAQNLLNMITQPQGFVEISEELAQEKGIAKGDMVKVSSKRGYIKAVAVVTKRVKPLMIHGKRVHTIGIPIHWGFSSVAGKSFIANTLTPRVGDANSQTPEYKTFLVNLERVDVL